MFSAALRSLRHTVSHSLLATSMVLGGWVMTPVLAHAQEFVSVKGNSVNVRAQPNARSEVKWELSKGYPLQVVRKQGNWLRVRDHEAPLGWVMKSLTHKQAHHVVKARTANMRSGPGQNTRVVGKLEQHEVVRTLSKQSGWVKVSAAGGKQGWVAQNLLWGW